MKWDETQMARARTIAKQTGVKPSEAMYCLSLVEMRKSKTRWDQAYANARDMEILADQLATRGE